MFWHMAVINWTDVDQMVSLGQSELNNSGRYADVCFIESGIASIP